jgi:hypothetical protein
MGFTSGLIGIGGSLMGMFGGGGANSVNLPPQFNMPNMGGAANSAFSGIGGLDQYTNMASGVMPNATNTFSNMYNNPNAGTLMSGAFTGQGLGEASALNAWAGGNSLVGAGINALPYAQTIANTAMDPQSALYNRTVQQTQDQTRAGLEARGINMTPYGGGVEGQTMSNFNIDWQNNQLQRQALGAQGISSLLSGAGGAINTGAGVANTAPSQFVQAAGMPYSTSMGIYGDQNTAINQLLGIGTSGANLSNIQIQDYLDYLRAGTGQQGANNQTAQLALAQQNQGFNQNMQLGSMLGGGLSMLGRSNTPGWMGGGGGSAFWPSSSFMSGGMGWG